MGRPYYRTFFVCQIGVGGQQLQFKWLCKDQVWKIAHFQFYEQPFSNSIFGGSKHYVFDLESALPKLLIEQILDLGILQQHNGLGIPYFP